MHSVGRMQSYGMLKQAARIEPLDFKRLMQKRYIYSITAYATDPAVTTSHSEPLSFI
jgi:hypothetical protein